MSADKTTVTDQLVSVATATGEQRVRCELVGAFIAAANGLMGCGVGIASIMEAHLTAVALMAEQTDNHDQVAALMESWADDLKKRTPVGFMAAGHA